ncbi:MAG TPA: dihydropteroate synthase [Actinomycetota bacterium]|nr:dihydropteroate synthase [Actinomycetota bacterium]
MDGEWRCRERSLPLGDRTLVMGIVNVTPDSFSDGGTFDDAAAAVKHGLRLLEEGADLLDVGGESTRPGSDPVGEHEERDRVLPVIEGLRREAPEAVLSVDTRKPAVAIEALGAGADVVNDVGAGADPAMFEVVAAAGAGMVLMHMRGDPKTMQDAPSYGDVVAEVRRFLSERVASAVAAGIGTDRLAVDPGIGFGKDLGHNLELLRSIGSLRAIGAPVVVGASRKRFVGQLSHVEDPSDRLEGSLAAAVWCATQGVAVVRVHDVGATVRALRVVDAIARGRS